MSDSAKASLRKTPKVPWEEFEREVKKVLEAEDKYRGLTVSGKSVLKSGEDEYEVDASAEFEMFGGALFKVIIECKCYTRPVNRDLVMTLQAKKEELKAHKAMLFSTSGFQCGAVKYAKKHGIALVKLADGASTYMTRSESPPERLPYYVPKLVCLLRPALGAYTVLGPENPDALSEWLLEPVPTSDGAEIEDDPTPDMDAPRTSSGDSK